MLILLMDPLVGVGSMFYYLGVLTIISRHFIVVVIGEECKKNIFIFTIMCRKGYSHSLYHQI